MAYRGLAALPEGQPDVPDSIRLATPSRVPLFAVGLDHYDTLSTSADIFLVDLRRNRKRLPLSFTCVDDLIAGSCGAYDTPYQSPQVTLDCQWRDSAREFHCRVEERAEATWGARVSTADLPLSGQPDPGVAVGKESTEQVERLARRTVSKQGPSFVDTGQWGIVHAIDVVPAESGGSLVLLGAAGLSSRFGARFLVVKLDRDLGATLYSVTDVPIRPAYWQHVYDNDLTEIIIGGRPSRSNLSFAVQRLESSRDLKALVRVRVRDGDANAVYLIGLNEQAGTFAASAMRLATDTSEYFRCVRAVTPSNVFDVRRIPGGPFRAELDVEPPHEVAFEDDSPMMDSDHAIEVDAPGCPTTMTVRWDRGFRLQEPEAQPECPEPSKSRFVEIHDDGTIVAVRTLKAKGR